MLVSIIVMTFNSERTVIETLVSAHQQDYPHVQLIISDDGSTDKTQELVNHWLVNHGERFTSVITLFSNANNGICMTVDKAIKQSNGIWLKLIAGDDILVADAITAFRQKAEETSADIIIAQVLPFHTSPTGDMVTGTPFPTFIDLDQITQLTYLNHSNIAQRNLIAAPSVFFSRALYKACGGIDLRFKHLEDWPLWMNIILTKGRFATIKKPLAYYRTTSGISMRSAEFCNKDYMRDLALFHFKYQRKHFTYLQTLHKDLAAIRMLLAAGLLHKKPKLYTASKLIFLISPQAYILILTSAAKWYRALTTK